jgi:hypothetical protein
MGDERKEPANKICRLFSFSKMIFHSIGNKSNRQAKSREDFTSGNRKENIKNLFKMSLFAAVFKDWRGAFFCDKVGNKCLNTQSGCNL